MLTYSLNDTGSDSLYIYIYKCIKNDILHGVLAPDTKLPSKRSFAKNLGVSIITIENAYATLLSEGYIYTIPKKGFYVSDSYSDNSKRDNASLKKNDNASPQYEYEFDFVSSQINPDQFPFSTWAKLMRETISKKSHELMKPSPGGGIAQLRVAIAGHLKQFKNMNVSPEQIIIGAGSDYLYSLIIQLLGFDKAYATENPGYKKIADIYRSHNVKCHFLNMDDKGVIISELNKCGADVAHVSLSHHYPTGIVTPASRRYELLGWLSENSGRYIIEDDYDSEFRVSEKNLPTLQSIDMTDRVIYINTFSKSLASTMRISYMVLPFPLIEVFKNKLGFYACTVSTFEQYTLAKFIYDGYFENHINRMRTYYSAIRDEFIKSLSSNPAFDGTIISEEKSGLHFLLKLNTDRSDSDIIKKAAEKGIKISCLSQYYTDDRNITQKNTLLINYSAIKLSDIERVVSMLGECI